MTIKQQGGIFGRNPTLNNVTVDGTLTVDQIVEKTGATGITLDGVTLKDGNVVLADSKGIDFSATSGTGTSELFDDYEQGSWTPTLFGATTTGSYTFTTQSGRYTKVGDVVYVTAQLNVDAVNTALSGNVRFGGWPYASNLDAGLRLMVTTSGVNWDSATYLHFYGYFHASTTMQIRGVRDNGNQSALGSSAFTVGANDIVTITGFYFV